MRRAVEQVERLVRGRRCPGWAATPVTCTSCRPQRPAAARPAKEYATPGVNCTAPIRTWKSRKRTSGLEAPPVRWTARTSPVVDDHLGDLDERSSRGSRVEPVDATAVDPGEDGVVDRAGERDEQDRPGAQLEAERLAERDADEHQRRDRPAQPDLPETAPPPELRQVVEPGDRLAAAPSPFGIGFQSHR